MKISMRLYQRDNGIWYVATDSGRRISLKTKDETKAKRAHRHLRQVYLDAKIARLMGECRTSLAEFKTRYDEWSIDALPVKTGRANRLALRKLEHYAGPSIRLDMIGRRHIDAMVADLKRRGRTERTINHYIRHARTVLNKAVDWEDVKRNPLEGVKEIRAPKLEPRFLHRREIAPFLASIADVELRRLVTAYLATGRRLSGLLLLRWEDIHGDRYWVRTKGGDRCSFRINTLFRSVLDAQGPPGDDRVFSKWSHPDSVSHAVKRALVAFGRPDLSTHSLRHTYAALLVMEGRSLRELQGLLGHSEMRTTEIYAHLESDHLDAIDEVQIGPVDLIGAIKRCK